MSKSVGVQFFMSFKDFPLGYSWLYYDGFHHIINLGIVCVSWWNGRKPFWVKEVFDE